MAKHTSGRWEIATIDCGEADDEIVTSVNGCTVNIAAIFGAGEYIEGRPNGETEPHYEVSRDEATANAQLLCAAPELLATIKAICAAFPSMRGLTVAQTNALFNGCAIVKEVER